MSNNREMSFSEEIENDLKKTTQMLQRENAPFTTEKEKNAINIFKRVLTVIDKGGLSVSNNESVVSASNNSLPATSYLSHGSRVLVQIPPLEDGDSAHNFINWLVTGDKSQQFIADSNKSNPLFQRTVSSHSTHIEKINDQKCFVEDKGVIAGALDAIRSSHKPKQEGHHFGLNLAFGIDQLGKDSQNKQTSNTPDGEHGHMYMHYRAPSKDQPGSLMIGVENSEPGKSNHSLIGTPGSTTHLGGSKWNKMQTKYTQETQDKTILIPSTLNGLRVDIDKNTVDLMTSNKIAFEQRSIDTPPKVAANHSKHKLVNKKPEKTITLTELMIENCDHQHISLSSTPYSSATANRSKFIR